MPTSTEHRRRDQLLAEGSVMRPPPVGDHPRCDILRVTQGRSATRTAVGTPLSAGMPRTVGLIRTGTRTPRGVIGGDALLDDRLPYLIVGRGRLEGDGWRRQQQADDDHLRIISNISGCSCCPVTRRSHTRPRPSKLASWSFRSTRTITNYRRRPSHSGERIASPCGH